MSRSISYDAVLAKHLRDIEFAREYVLASLEEGLPVQEALGKIIRAYGVKEYTKKIHMAPSNLVRAVNPATKSITTKTLNQILKPLGLELTLRRIGGAA